MTERYEKLKNKLKIPLIVEATYSRTGISYNDSRMVCVQNLYINGEYITDHLWIPVANTPKLGGNESVRFEAIFIKRKRPAKNFMGKAIIDIQCKNAVNIIKL